MVRQNYSFVLRNYDRIVKNSEKSLSHIMMVMIWKTSAQRCLNRMLKLFFFLINKDNNFQLSATLFILIKIHLKFLHLKLKGSPHHSCNASFHCTFHFMVILSWQHVWLDKSKDKLKIYASGSPCVCVCVWSRLGFNLMSTVQFHVQFHTLIYEACF